MKRFFIIFCFFVSLLTISIFLIVIPRAEKIIISNLEEIGFKNISFSQTKPTFTGLKISSVQLDKDGFNSAENIKVNIYWPTYFLKPTTKNIIIDDLKISAVPSELKDILKILNNANNISGILAQNIIIHKITYDLALDTKALRFEGRLMLKENDEQSHILRAVFDGVQHELAFQSIWSGKINYSNRNLTIDGTFENVKVNLPPTQINRGAGWFSYISNAEENELGMQITAGSGKFFDIPLQNLNFTLGRDDNGYPLLFRSNIIGIEDSKFMADFYYANQAANRKFRSELSIPNQNDFMKILEINRVITKTPNFDQEPPSSVNAEIYYVAEKRFAGGPLPFDITFNQNMNGTILIYPDSLDVRGTIEGDENTINYLDALIGIPEENISNNVIRLDSNIKSLIN